MLDGHKRSKYHYCKRVQIIPEKVLVLIQYFVTIEFICQLGPIVFCQNIIKGKVIRVADGDTITILDEDNTQTRNTNTSGPPWLYILITPEVLFSFICFIFSFYLTPILNNRSRSGQKNYSFVITASRMILSLIS
jgi:hypothetical protein